MDSPCCSGPISLRKWPLFRQNEECVCCSWIVLSLTLSPVAPRVTGVSLALCVTRSPGCTLIGLLRCCQEAPHAGWLGATEMNCLAVLEAGSLKSRCQQAWFPLRAVRESRLQASVLGPESCLLHVCALSSFCCVSVQISPFGKVFC